MQPLKGIRIVAVEQFGAGPYGTLFLAELGAEVIKIENPAEGGEVSRRTGPHFLGDHDSHFFQVFNKSKSSLSLNLKSEQGQRIFRELVKTADAITNNLRGNQPDKLGLTYDHLSDIKPSIVCAHLSAYGRGNSRSSHPGYDFLMQAEAGFLSVTGEPGSPPARFGLSIVDFMSGMNGAFATVSAILGAKSTGVGCDMDVCLFDVALHQLTYPAVWYLNEGDKVGRRPRSGHPAAVPCELFPTEDGWVFVMCMIPKFWQVLVTGLGCPELIQDPRFADLQDRRKNRDELAAILDAIFRTATTAHWVDRFSGELPIAPVYDVAQALENPFLAENDMIHSYDHPSRENFRVLASPIRVNGRRPESRPAPALGEDNDRLLQQLGYDAEARAKLREDGVI